MYRVWSKPRTSRYWSDLPYGGTSYEECERLIEYYEREYGNLYHYRIEPTHVVLNHQAAWA
jgi:serine/threonine protein kinase HipA of HipAB toxin-antitoxin module